MEGSDATTEHDEQVPAEGESADGTPVAVGNDGSQPSDAPHDPNKAGPASPDHPSTLSGDPLDPATKAGLGVPGAGPVPNQGESVSVADQEAERQRQEAADEAGQ